MTLSTSAANRHQVLTGDDLCFSLWTRIGTAALLKVKSNNQAFHSDATVNLSERRAQVQGFCFRRCFSGPAGIGRNGERGQWEELILSDEYRAALVGLSLDVARSVDPIEVVMIVDSLPNQKVATQLKARSGYIRARLESDPNPTEIINEIVSMEGPVRSKGLNSLRTVIFESDDRYDLVTRLSTVRYPERNADILGLLTMWMHSDRKEAMNWVSESLQDADDDLRTAIIQDLKM